MFLSSFFDRTVVDREVKLQVLLQVGLRTSASLLLESKRHVMLRIVVRGYDMDRATSIEREVDLLAPCAATTTCPIGGWIFCSAGCYIVCISFGESGCLDD